MTGRLDVEGKVDRIVDLATWWLLLGEDGEDAGYTRVASARLVSVIRQLDYQTAGVAA